MNKQTDERLDEILAQAMFGDRFTLAQAQNIAEFKQARTEILKHYISRDEVMEKLPKKRPDAIKQGEIIPFDGKKKVEMHWLRKCQDAGYNQAISDMRQALTTNEEE